MLRKSRVSKWAFGAVIALAGFLAMPQQADAGVSISIGGSRGGFSYYSGHRHHGHSHYGHRHYHSPYRSSFYSPYRRSGISIYAGPSYRSYNYGRSYYTPRSYGYNPYCR